MAFNIGSDGGWRMACSKAPSRNNRLNLGTKLPLQLTSWSHVGVQVFLGSARRLPSLWDCWLMAATTDRHSSSHTRSKRPAISHRKWKGIPPLQEVGDIERRWPRMATQLGAVQGLDKCNFQHRKLPGTWSSSPQIDIGRGRIERAQKQKEPDTGKMGRQQIARALSTESPLILLALC